MKTAIYSGSFDPVTKGHEEVIRKSLKFVDRLIILITGNTNKKSWFSLEERKHMLSLVTANSPRVEIDAWDGLLVDYMTKRDVDLIIRGLRAVADYEYELVYALTNNQLSDGRIDTIFIPASRETMYLSSSGVREAAAAKAPLTLFVNDKIAEFVKTRAAELAAPIKN
ncbi:MAG: pantetheine-phosphate adenylyltransferase [Fusobacteriaceae bacterium]|jgi:pantetheine-phosphate adenylyltransferase|nr:pantetheine-phosphate adenylyltransferase [Fusobacteriaceae bacterium]